MHLRRVHERERVTPVRVYGGLRDVCQRIERTMCVGNLQHRAIRLGWLHRQLSGISGDSKRDQMGQLTILPNERRGRFYDVLLDAVAPGLVVNQIVRDHSAEVSKVHSYGTTGGDCRDNSSLVRIKPGSAAIELRG